ncbi:chromosome partitioning protein ParB [Sphingopyxis sp. H038]|uniref:ParB/RepB/Spo0J family partition protein n=1 Tax=unclassified Sphingopyxis TaxID=2614943 RepID=UPI0007313D1F|nr:MULTISPECIES: ParB/RepB/Spo0J family partition protein [unclassified Sphingopyxis]KTD99959.1 chromosome partitioning protein ParB [Sphingopyxis sp. H012]KTE07145.1 chromosome partitioning protein ParB [Sphingopyxis sp. H053]KTE09029.1 chromosome partitioning protein ParB [Sphingopyxis sp. H093]KTE25306.1 chromosome partitioning protein ParB [Sphingopyxis sp. H080]KTE36329.1 chromosome partitioning protein ParB [Sphingopyxis sp. H038]
MELKHIDIAHLSVSPANMRGVTKKPDLTNILPSVRARGILVPLIVRPSGAEGTYEIVAGKRRYHAALTIAGEQDGMDPLPCAVMEAGDDAAALEASLIENIARLDPDEINRCEAFTRLVREGRSIEDIELTFGLTSLQVKRTLAIGNLLPRIRTMYRTEKVDVVTMRHLTLASKTQQRDWLALVDCPEKRAPTGSQLKAWLFGGSAIATKVAMFDLAGYPGEIVSDLYDEDRYFADSEVFWTAQMAEVEKQVSFYHDTGWSDDVVMERGAYFDRWEYERCPKKKGGKIFVTVSHRGEVAFHEGYITNKEARRRAKGEMGSDAAKPARPEVSAALGNYIDLHRHVAVRASLLSEPGIALRMIVAHAIVGSPLWRVDVEKQRAASDAIAESVEVSQSEAAFDTKRREVLALLGFDAETPTVTGGYDGEHGVAGLFVRLAALSDEAVMSILPVVMGETLAVASAEIDMLGRLLGTDMRACWQDDTVLPDLIRDKQLLTAIVAEVAGDDVAEANADTTAKVQRGILVDCLTGSNGRAKVEGWLPKYFAFPPSGYRDRGGIGCVERSARIAPLLTPAQIEEEPEMRQAA